MTDRKREYTVSAIHSFTKDGLRVTAFAVDGTEVELTLKDFTPARLAKWRGEDRAHG